MKRRAFFASIIAATIGFSMPAAAYQVSLPIGGGERGYSTGINFSPTSAQAPGTFQGIVIERMDPNVIRVRIVDQYGNRDVLYDGPVQPGQFIPFTALSVAWTAWTDTRGTDAGGVKARVVYN